MSDFPKTNIMVFQRSFREDLFTKMIIAKKKGIKCIYEIDDDMFHMPEGFQKPYDFYRQPKVRQQMVDFMDNADALTVSTGELAKSLAFILPKKPIYVVENALDVCSWNDAFAKKSKKNNITIGWMASGSHLIDTPLVRDVLEIVMEKYPQVSMHFIGWIGFDSIGLEQFKDRIIVEDWVSIESLPYAMQNFDINICPLIDNQFNRCKSGLKWMQGAALGIPSICSPLPPYTEIIEDNVDGLLADSPESWLACLSEMIENTQLRNEIGLKARAKLLDKHDMGNNFMQWANVFERIMRG